MTEPDLLTNLLTIFWAYKGRLGNAWGQKNRLIAGFLGVPSLFGMTRETYMVPRGGIEPPTRGFSIPCSTD